MAMRPRQTPLENTEEMTLHLQVNKYEDAFRWIHGEQRKYTRFGITVANKEKYEVDEDALKDLASKKADSNEC